MLEEGFAPEVEDSEDGTRITTNWEVYTDDAGAATNHELLPAMGSLYSDAYPLCQLRRKRCAYVSGRNNPDGGTYGWCRVRLEYDTRSRRTRLEPLPFDPQEGLKYTIPRTGTNTVTRFFEYVPPRPGVTAPSQQLLPVNNGQGMPVQDTTLSLTVVKYYTQAEFAAIDWWLRSFDFFGTVNHARQTLPKLMREGPELVIEPGQLLYLSIGEPQKVKELWEIRHELAWAQDHLFRWLPEDANGRAIPGTPLEARRYPEAQWPASLF